MQPQNVRVSKEKPPMKKRKPQSAKGSKEDLRRKRKFHKPKTKNRHITEASSAYLPLEGEGDIFGFIKREFLIANHTKAIP
jgi:hypothetical protein